MIPLFFFNITLNMTGVMSHHPESALGIWCKSDPPGWIAPSFIDPVQRR